MGDLIPIVAIMAPFSIPIIAIWLNHQRKIAEIQSRNLETMNVATRTELDILKRDFENLRDTVTQHSMSLDNTMRRLDDTMLRMEERLNRLENAENRVNAPNRLG
jgi:hypothetical protein